ncbi:hypothetical protein L6164_023403 [Bauhinia variegata]|uniref:Uncharacterized protein n=1 Tax=Bauhinia variegata TaxID=167791 RepID=A0ACB9MIJ3_BAUVA|nr:hypothetical protein L6164_023403 [Bauhinia variegata]
MMNSSAESQLSSQWKSPTGTRSRRRPRFMVAEAEAEAKEAKEEQEESFIPDPDMQHAAQTLIGLSMGSTELIKGEPRVTTDLVEEEEDNIQLTEFDNEEAVSVQAPDKPLDKKLKSKVEEDDYEDDENNNAGGDGGSDSDSDAVQDGKRHQCPVCLKMFASGQGLGGHKRVHIPKSGAGKGNKPSTSSAGKSDKPSAAKLRPCLYHNLPPPETDEEVISIVDLSTSSSDEELFG